MLTDSLQDHIFTLSYTVIPVLLGIILHEVAHGYAAYRMGDPTAKRAGRLTLNPLPHIDPAGLIVFILTAITGPFVFGWAKPVPIDMRHFRKPRFGLVATAAAGPLTNLALALLFAVFMKALITFTPDSMQGSTPAKFLWYMARAGIFVNLGLAWFNLIPIPPLDGSRIVTGLLPYTAARRYASLERYGFVILLVFLMTDLSSKILYPPVRASLGLILKLTGLD